jgi:hypothetical protein
MQFRLRTLLIVLALGPVVLAGAWFGWQRFAEQPKKSEFDRLIELIDKTVPKTPESSTDAFNNLYIDA